MYTKLYPKTAAVRLVSILVWLAVTFVAEGYTESINPINIWDVLNVHRVNATHLCAVGKTWNNSISTTLMNGDGVPINAHSFNVNGLSKELDSIMTEEGELMVMGVRQSGKVGVKVLFVAKFGSCELNLVWIKSYEGMPGYLPFTNAFRVSRRANPRRYVFYTESPGVYCRKLVEIDGNGGEIVWEKEFCLGKSICTYESHTILGTMKGDGILFLLACCNGTIVGYSFRTHCICHFDSDRNMTSYVIPEDYHVYKLLETEDEGFVAHMVDEDHLKLGNNPYHSLVLKLNKDMFLRWKCLIPDLGTSMGSDMIETSNSNYVVGSNTRYNQLTLVEVLKNGTLGWRNSIYNEYVNGELALIELIPRRYIVATRVREHSNFGIIRFTVPDDIDFLPSLDISNYKRCPLGFHFDGTTCAACLTYCDLCHISTVCLRCAHGYVSPTARNDSCVRNRTSARKPVTVCNCGVPPEEMLAECRRSCPAPIPRYCYLFEGSIATLKSGGDCLCPPESVDNGTHCVRTTNTLCPALCETCTIGAPNSWYEIYCVKCADLPNVFTYRTGSLRWNSGRHIVDCQCRVGYVFNGSDCNSPPRRNQTAVETGGKRQGAVIVLAAVGAAVLVCVFVIVIRRRKRRAGPAPVLPVPAEDSGSSSQSRVQQQVNSSGAAVTTDKSVVELEEK